MAKFEAHITMPRDQARAADEVASQVAWTLSRIDGDPVMGQQPYCYLTAYDPGGNQLLARMHAVSTRLRAAGVTVLREKSNASCSAARPAWTNSPRR